jgi:hypothetical protein
MIFTTRLFAGAENNDKTWSTRHTHSTLGPCMALDHTYLMQYTYNNLLVVPMRSKQASTPERSLGTQWSPSLAIILGHLILPPSCQPWSRGEKVWSCSYTATRFIRPITPTCDQDIQYLLTRVNLSVLNQHRQGLQLLRCWLSRTLSLPFPTDGPPLST